MKKSSLTALEVGSVLQKSREQLGVTIKDASHALHIPSRQLEALEAGRVSEFSAVVYARGALRSYARYLGVEDRPLERAISMAMREQSRPKPLHIATFAKWHERILSGNTVVAVGIAFGVLVVGSYVVWQVNSFWRLPRLELVSPKHAVVSESKVLVQGITERDTRVTINGQPVMVSEDNAFEQEMPLAKGVTVLKVEATGPSGRVAVQEKHLLRPRTPR